MINLTKTDCECWTWGRDKIIILTKHHPNCPKYNPEQDAKDIILRLIKGIECWAIDEDGIHPDVWDAYVDACAMLMNPVSKK